MAYLCVDEDTSEILSTDEPIREYDEFSGYHWTCSKGECIVLPNGSIETLIGKSLTFKDEPVKI